MLPHAWKTVGFVVAAAALVAAFVAALAFGDKIWVGYCMSLLVMGLLTAATSKDRREDEMLRQMRLTAYVSAFVIGVLFVAVQPFISLLFGAEYDYNAVTAVVFMLLMYHSAFYAMKKRARREKHD